jgi:hypothetical protein
MFFFFCFSPGKFPRLEKFRGHAFHRSEGGTSIDIGIRCVFTSASSFVGIQALTMLVLYETAMGFALFKLTDSAKLTDPNLHKEFETPEKANGLCVKDIHRQGILIPSHVVLLSAQA